MPATPQETLRSPRSRIDATPQRPVEALARQNEAPGRPPARLAPARIADHVRMRLPPSIFQVWAVAFGALLASAPDAIAQVGLFDPSWRPGGRVVLATPGTVTSIQAAGSRWMVGGPCTIALELRGCALRLMANGDVDTTYGDPAQGNTAQSDVAGLESGESYRMQSDAAGQVWFARNPGAGPVGVGRINAAGTAATHPPVEFDFADGALSSFVSQLLAAPDGSTYVIGNSRFDGINSDFGIARLTPDLQLDPTFNGTGVRTIGFDEPAIAVDKAEAAALQPDGRLVVAGTSFSGTGSVTLWVARLLTDGSLDPSFAFSGRIAIGGSPGATVGAVALDAQGRITIAGARQFTVGNHDGYVIRLTPGGFFDATFGDGGRAALGFNLVPDGDDFLHAMVVQPGGQILVGGRAERNDLSRDFFALARVNINGVYDTSFGAGGISFGTFGPVPVPSSASDTVRAMALDDQGRLMVAGHHEEGINRSFGVGRIVTGIVTDSVFEDGFE